MSKRGELEWVEKLGQWRVRKQVKGKRQQWWLGAGKGWHDNRAYEKAKAKWEAIKADLNRPSLTTVKVVRQLVEQAQIGRERIDKYLKPTAPGIKERKDLYNLADAMQLELLGEMPQRPPPHIHQKEAGSFYVMEGEFSFLCGDHTIQATAGSFVHVPPGTLHTYKNTGTKPGRLLVAISPAGFERFFEEVGHPVRDSSSRPPVEPAAIQRVLELAPKYGLEIRGEMDAGQQLEYCWPDTMRSFLARYENKPVLREAQ
jgi:mannose-6-phosphate isomerase-like protein (cupin superfamily)